MVRTNQGGSLLGFIAVGSVMVLLLIGGVYFVRQNLMSETDSDPVAVEDIDTDVDNGTGTSDDKDTETSKEESSSQYGSAYQEKQEDDDTEDAITTPPEQPTDTEALPGTGSSTVSPDTLPETGLSSTVLTSIVIGGVVAAFVAYLRSRALSVSL